MNVDGTLNKLKAHIVAKGFLQEEGIDYLETYSPVVRTPTVSKSDPSLFVYAHNNNLILLLLYVDDMVITGNSSQTLTRLLSTLNKEF